MQPAWPPRKIRLGVAGYLTRHAPGICYHTATPTINLHLATVSMYMRYACWPTQHRPDKDACGLSPVCTCWRVTPWGFLVLSLFTDMLHLVKGRMGRAELHGMPCQRAPTGFAMNDIHSNEMVNAMCIKRHVVPPLSCALCASNQQVACRRHVDVHWQPLCSSCRYA